MYAGPLNGDPCKLKLRLRTFEIGADNSVAIFMDHTVKDGRKIKMMNVLQESATTEKKNLEKKLKETSDTPVLNTTTSDLEVSKLKAEVEVRQ